MKSFNDVINEKKSLKKKWLETPEYSIDRTLFDYKNKFYGNKDEVTNEILYLMLIDVMDKLDKLEKYISDDSTDNDIMDKLDRIEEYIENAENNVIEY